MNQSEEHVAEETRFISGCGDDCVVFAPLRLGGRIIDDSNIMLLRKETAGN